MANQILDERDQQFILYEMLEAETLCEHEKYADFSRDMFDMILTEAQKFATEEILPTLADSDKQGCRLEDGQVYVPECFHKPYKLFCEGGWIGMAVPPEEGGQGTDPPCGNYNLGNRKSFTNTLAQIELNRLNQFRITLGLGIAGCTFSGIMQRLITYLSRCAKVWFANP